MERSGGQERRSPRRSQSRKRMWIPACAGMYIFYNGEEFRMSINEKRFSNDIHKS